MNARNTQGDGHRLVFGLSELSRTIIFPQLSEDVPPNELTARYKQDRLALTVADRAGFSLLRERLVKVGFAFAFARGRLESWPRFTVTAGHRALPGQVRFLLLSTSQFDWRRGRLEVYVTKQGLPADFLTEGSYRDPATYVDAGSQLASLVKHH